MSIDEEVFFSDGLDDFVVDNMAPEGTPSKSDFPRPAKKRRLETAKAQPSPHELQSDNNGSNTDLGSFIDDDGYGGGQTDDDDNLPSSSQAYKTAGVKPKRKAFVPKQQNHQENLFVTLTQPPSPPDMLRGPRWQKPKPAPPRAASPGSPTQRR